MGMLAEGRSVEVGSLVGVLLRDRFRGLCDMNWNTFYMEAYRRKLDCTLEFQSNIKYCMLRLALGVGVWRWALELEG